MQIDLFQTESIEHIPGKRPDTQTRQRIARQNKPDHRLTCHKLLFQIKRQYRQKQVESKEKQEIGCQDITKIKRKKLVFNHSIFKTKCKSNNN